MPWLVGWLDRALLEVAGSNPARCRRCFPWWRRSLRGRRGEEVLDAAEPKRLGDFARHHVIPARSTRRGSFPAAVAPHAATTHPPTMTHTALAHLSSKARSRRRVTSAAAVTAGANALAICASDSDTYVRAEVGERQGDRGEDPGGQDVRHPLRRREPRLELHAPAPHERPRDDRSEERTERRDEDRGSGVDDEVLVGEHQGCGQGDVEGAVHRGQDPRRRSLAAFRAASRRAAGAAARVSPATASTTERARALPLCDRDLISTAASIGNNNILSRSTARGRRVLVTTHRAARHIRRPNLRRPRVSV